MIVLDTCILSLAYRRRKAEPEPVEVAVLRRMVAERWPLTVPGIVLQELLSGVRTAKESRALRKHMQPFPVLLADEDHHLRAAEITNACRSAGLSCSTIDALIAAQTIGAGGRLFTTDRDFEAMAAHCDLELLRIQDAANT